MSRVAFTLSTSLVFFLLLADCHHATEPPPAVSPSIPTTKAKGPGGPTFLAGYINDFVHPSRAVTNTHIFVMNPGNYDDTLLHVLVTSSAADFIATDLPEGKVDLIFLNENYLCAKLGKINLKAGGNSFYNPNSTGFFIDSTVYITSFSDTIGRPDAPPYGLQGYGPALTVFFKSESPDSVSWEIVRASGCDTIRVYRYDDPVFDPYENDVYYLRCRNVRSVSGRLIFFNWMKEVKGSSPDYVVIQGQ